MLWLQTTLQGRVNMWNFSVQVIKKYIIEYLRSTQEHTDQGEIGQSVCKCTVVAHDNNVVQYIYYVLLL